MQGELSTARPSRARRHTETSVKKPPALDEATRSFVRRVLEAGLAEIDDIKKVVVSLMADSDRFSPRRLAEGLVGANVLTHWQATKLLAGKSKGFYLGSYQLLRPLGKGGMGVVYLGEHHVMKRLMALKILPPEATKDQRRIDRFKEEARACAQLDHPNIVRAYDFAEAGSKLYIVMEYVEGIDLQHAVQRDGVMSCADAIDAITQATAGLAHAHERGIIHRDIKPSNLLLRTDGVLKVSDLGLARIGWAGEGGQDKNRLVGTADFVAPEQALNSKTVDTRADIYSLACTLFYLLTGRPPFGGDSLTKRLAQHQTAPVPDIRTFRSDCPSGIAELTMRMMAKRPEDRPKSAVELLAQLKRLGAVAGDGTPPQRLQVAPAGDTSVDDAVYQATIDDTSLSADGEVQIVADVDVVEAFDFGSLPPVDLAAAPPPGPSPLTQTAPAGPKRPAASKAKPKSSHRSGGEPTGNQQVLLGVGLALSIVALLAVVGIGIYSMLNADNQVQPKLKAVEDGKGGHVVIIRD